MRFSAKGLVVTSQRLSSQRELRQALSRLDHATTVLLGEANLFAGEYDLLQIAQGNSTLAVGLCHEGQGLEPQVHLLDREHLLLGFNREVVKLQVPDGAVVWQLHLGALFWQLVEFEWLDRLLVIHELGALCLTPEGEECWRYDKDLLEQFAIKKESLVLRFVKAPGVRLDLRTGEPR